MVRPLKYDDKPQTEAQRQRSINHDFIIYRLSTIWFLLPLQKLSYTEGQETLLTTSHIYCYYLR